MKRLLKVSSCLNVPLKDGKNFQTSTDGFSTIPQKKCKGTNKIAIELLKLPLKLEYFPTR